jgi:hypothetical protein
VSPAVIISISTPNTSEIAIKDNPSPQLLKLIYPQYSSQVFPLLETNE